MSMASAAGADAPGAADGKGEGRGARFCVVEDGGWGGRTVEIAVQHRCMPAAT
jgi:hypothetical protein